MKCIEDEIPFEVPEGWEWCRLTEITFEIFAGGDKPENYSKTQTDEFSIPIFANGAENDGLYGFTNKARVNKSAITVSARGTIDFCCIRHMPFVPIVRLITIVPAEGINIEYLRIVFQALIETGEGSSIPQLTVPGIKPKLIPIPPYSEQTRISNKLIETEKIVSAVELNQESVVNYIKLAKAKILDLAIRGQLVPQDPNDEPALVLLERIRAEKEELIKAGKIKRDKKESIIFRGEDNSYYEKIGNEVHCIDEDIPFKIPHNWIWCRMSSISDIIMGTSPKGTSICENPQYTEFHQGKIHFSDMLIKNSGQYTRALTKIAKPNSILLCVRAPVGEVNLTDRKICIGRGLASISPLGAVSKYFMLYWIKAFRETLIKKATGTTFVAVTTDVVKGLLLPIPPLAEQYRITNKIQSLVENLIYIEKSLR